MHLDINKFIFICIGWLIRASYQLECVQCTSSIRRVSQSWDHSCLDGTLRSLPCPKLVNISAAPYRLCVSDLYRIGQRGIAGVVIQRGCKNIERATHECDPAASTIDLEGRVGFYCSFKCSDNGCNRHTVDEILSNAKKLLKNEVLFLDFICFMFLFIFKYNLFS